MSYDLFDDVTDSQILNNKRLVHTSQKLQEIKMRVSNSLYNQVSIDFKNSLLLVAVNKKECT